MKILMTGATGFVGKKLTAKLISMGHDIHVLTRDKQKAKSIFPDSHVTAFEWKNNLELPPKEAITGINGVINLMGENIAAKRWSDEQKKILKGQAIQKLTVSDDLRAFFFIQNNLIVANMIFEIVANLQK